MNRMRDSSVDKTSTSTRTRDQSPEPRSKSRAWQCAVVIQQDMLVFLCDPSSRKIETGGPWGALAIHPSQAIERPYLNKNKVDGL